MYNKLILNKFQINAKNNSLSGDSDDSILAFNLRLLV